MISYLLFNTVNFDGVGDFVHLEEIVEELLARSEFNDVKLVAFIYFFALGLEERYQNIQRRLDKLAGGSRQFIYFYGRYQAHLSWRNDALIASLFQEARQLVIISYDKLSRIYQDLIPPPIVVKYIGEHEGLTGERLCRAERTLNRSLGLGPNCYGIKLKNVRPLTRRAAIRTIQDVAPHFVACLLYSTGVSELSAVFARYELIPAYFNKINAFFSFLFLFVSNSTFPQNVIFYLSGVTSEHFLRQRIDESYFASCTDFQIEIIFQDHSIKLTPCPEDPSSRLIRVFCGFQIPTEAYHALFRLTKIAGVSGDNSLELAISMSVLPFYWSSNEACKRPTLKALREITQQRTLISSKKTRKSFGLFFDQTVLSRHEEVFEREFSHAKNDLSTVNFKAMHGVWRGVSSYLKEHKNFYSHLTSIFMENLRAPTPEVGTDLVLYRSV